MKLPRHICLTIQHNPHKGDYQPIEQWLANAIEFSGYDIAEDQRAAILATDEVWTMSWCPDTPVGSCSIAAASLEALLAAAEED